MANLQGQKRPPGRDPNSAAVRMPQTVRELRLASGLRLSELASRCGLAVSTISKIENQQISPTFDTLIALAGGLGVQVGDLLGAVGAESMMGRRSIHRAGTGSPLESGFYDYLFLNSEIAGKQFIPILTRIRARRLEDFPEMLSHRGEEFVYVLSGAVRLHTSLYTPTTLEVGDCAYFDSRMDHVLLSVSDDDAWVLWVSSTLSHLSRIDPIEPDADGNASGAGRS